MTTEPVADATAQTDYVYLDDEVRGQFAQVTHEYLMESLESLEYNDDILTEIPSHIMAKIIDYWVSKPLSLKIP